MPRITDYQDTATAGIKSRTSSGRRVWLEPSLLIALIALVACIPLAVVIDQVKIQSIYLSSPLGTDEQGLLSRHLKQLKGQNFWRLDVQATQQSLENLDWVLHSSVRKHWPGTLIVGITPEVPVASWNNQGFLNAAGKPILSLAAPKHLPRIDAQDSYSHIAAQLLALAREHFGSIKACQINAEGEAVITLATSDTLIYLGTSEFKSKITRAAQLLEKARSIGKQISRIDTRYSGGVAVVWRHQAKLVAVP